MNVVDIDGSVGEGGGQVLRSSLTLSAITGKPVQLRKIRAKRRKPGLMRQHLTAVRAAAQICNARVEGAEPGSTELRFTPRALRAGEVHAAVGTAGSACLVLQTILPALLRAEAASTVVVEGGTHNPLAPPYDFLVETFFPVLARMGAAVEARLVRPGFYPAGGGRIEVTIHPPPRLTPIVLTERRGEVKLSGQVLLVNLPQVIATREVEALEEKLGLPASDVEVDVRHEGPGPGNVVMVRACSDDHCEVFAGFGERSVSVARLVGALSAECNRYLAASAPVGVHLADQLIVPFALAGGGEFATVGLSAHTSTNIEVTQKFLDVPIRSEREERGGVRVVFG